MDIDADLRQILIDTYNLVALAAPEQDKLIAELADLMFQGVIVRAMQTMDKAGLDTFEKMLDDDKSPDDLISYLKTTVPDFDQLVKTEAEDLQKEAVEIMKKITS